MDKTNPDNVGVFKLISGEEIVAMFSGLTADKIDVKKVRAVLLGRDASGKMGIQLGPWILTEQDDEYTIDRQHILAMKIENVDARLVQAYLKNTTGIDVQTSAGNLIKP